MNREYPDRPIVGVGGVIFKNETVLLVKRAQAPGVGQWSLPGGAVELGETLTEALEREIREETNLGIEVGGLVTVLDRIIHDPEERIQYHYVIVDYWGWVVSGELKAASDISDARFEPLDRIETMKIHRDVKETVKAAAKMRKKSDRITGLT